uniref:Uncharacterized protein n=1 Tax=Timema cristinae TaxID=61476 RepID=A0A7R9DSW9_TIMCR|nr:unnamed protein product [Timema cristinae]
MIGLTYLYNLSVISVRDQVILLESGHCKVVGRLKEAIIRGGDNLFPSEIEEFFCKHPDVVDAQEGKVIEEKLNHLQDGD